MNKSPHLLQFPKGFYWGAATASHQVEGGNFNDWTGWETKNADRLAKEAEKDFKNKVPDWSRIAPEATNPQNYISGQGVDHYNKYKEDIQLMKQLGFTAYRFSIEWSRVEPEKNKFDAREIQHYREVIQELKANGIEPFVTLWHRSNPVWVAEQGDWENPETVKDYLSYVNKVVSEYKNDVHYWMPLNEPIFYILGSYLGGQYPPQVKSLWRSNKVFKNFVKAFNECSELIHELQNGSHVGTADAALYTESYHNKWYNRLTVKIMDYFTNVRFTKAVLTHADFLGVQYYTRGLVGWQWKTWYPKPGQIIEIRKQSDMGWELYPKGLYNFLMKLKKYGKPIFITENGIADALDAHREHYIQTHLTELHRAIQSGADVRGYLHWSLLDNLEWNKGFWPKFGLIEVNRTTMQRTIRPSALAYATIIRQNGLNATE